ncbi:MAG: hypothetical protein EAZ44_02820 [Cytophagia bacterium]|nr:MAG: hypothetical protein EAZ44_02820 [Cytophagia bacterium]
MYYRIYLFLFLIFLNHFLFAQQNNHKPKNIILKNNTFVNIDDNSIAYIEDKKSSYNIKIIDSLFTYTPTKTLKKANANFYLTPSSYWFRFEIKIKEENQKDNWLLKMDYALLDYIDLYYQDKNQKWQVKKTGDFYAFNTREIKDKAFVLKLPFNSTEKHIFYVRIKTNSVFQVPFSLENSSSYFQNILEEEVFLFILTGVFLTLIFYNLFLLLILKDFSYLLYVLFIINCAFLMTGIIGHNAQYIFYNNAFLAEVSIIPISCLFFFFLVWFTQQFLHIKDYSKFLYYCLETIKVLLLVNILFYCLTSQTILANRILHILILVGIFMLLITVIYATYRKIPHHFYFMIAFIFPIIGTSVYVLKLMNILPHIFLTTHASRVSLALQGVFFSFALADKYRMIKQKLIETQKNQNEKLEIKVKERTYQVEGLNQELQTQNEELQQSQEEILAQREFIQGKNKELQEQNTKINSSIQAALIIQQAILPYQEKKDKLLKNYFDIFLPKDVVSGDFYWLNEMNNKTFIAVIDCTGHGVPGAFMTMIANSLLDKIIRIQDIYAPAKILEHLHQDIKIMLRQDEINNNNGMDMSIITIEKKDDTTYNIEFAGAKNGLFYKENKNKKIQYLEGTRKGIGGQQNEKTHFEQLSLSLEKGSCLYLSTDGFIDQNNAQRKKIGMKNFTALLEKVANEEIQNQKQHLLQYLESHIQNTTQRDDICMIGIQLS